MAGIAHENESGTSVRSAISSSVDRHPSLSIPTTDGGPTRATYIGFYNYSWAAAHVVRTEGLTVNTAMFFEEQSTQLTQLYR